MKMKTLLKSLLVLSICLFIVLIVIEIKQQMKKTTSFPNEVVIESLPITIVQEDEGIATEEINSTETMESTAQAESDTKIINPVNNKIPLEPAHIDSSGYLVCIDPGHFIDASELEGDNLYGYQEAIVTLQIGLQLKEELKKYGIDSYLTRETDHITLSGYSDQELDSAHISLRGEYAKEADLFLSLHTNANSEHANGYDTCNQPIEINKTVLIVNQSCLEDNTKLQIANELGQAISDVNYANGIAFTNDFKEVDASTIQEWTTSANDSLYTVGSVYYRTGKKGDYYGVLRGATNAGVPGIIIEHGFHTVEEIRKQAMTADLASQWAKADAYAIAKGFGLTQ